MTTLSIEQEQLLVALYRASDGAVDRYHAVNEADIKLLESLLKRGLVQLEVEEVDGDDRWYTALTVAGLQMATDLLMQRPKILGVQIDFDLNNDEHTALVKQLADLDDEDRADVLSGLFGLHQSLKRGEIDALLAVYPDAVLTIRRMVQDAFEAQLMTHEQQRIEQLLDEVTSLKSMVVQNGIRPMQPAIPDDEADDSEPIASPAPTKLRPVVPGTLEGQPKQLTVPQFDLPSDDDEESDDLFVVKKDEDAGRRASQNFIESLQKLQK